MTALPLADRFTLFVPGRAVPQGSKTAFVSKSTGRPIVVDKDVRLPQWRMKVTAAAIEKQAEIMHTNPHLYLQFPFAEPIGIRVSFVLARPKVHYGTGRNSGIIKFNAPAYPSTMPDLDKLLRAIFDALTDSRVWLDDGQVVWCQASKHYTGPSWPGGEGVHVTLGPMSA
jgi:Holliday junction resolvase RusA-like endonuclease